MSVEKLEQELRNYDLNEKELKVYHSGKEMIDNAMKLSKGESEKTFLALLTYMSYKTSEKSKKARNKNE